MKIRMQWNEMIARFGPFYIFICSYIFIIFLFPTFVGPLTLNLLARF